MELLHRIARAVHGFTKRAELSLASTRVSAYEELGDVLTQLELVQGQLEGVDERIASSMDAHLDRLSDARQGVLLERTYLGAQLEALRSELEELVPLELVESQYELLSDVNRAIDELRGHHKAVSEDVELSVAYSDLLGSLDDFQARLRSEVYEPALGFESVNLQQISAESFLELIDQAARGELDPDPEPVFEWEEELERRFAVKLHTLGEVLSELGDLVQEVYGPEGEKLEAELDKLWETAVRFDDLALPHELDPELIASLDALAESEPEVVLNEELTLV